MKTLRPIICRKKHIDLIYKTLSRFLKMVYLQPILDVIEPIRGFYDNSLEDDIIIRALKEGRIQYIDGKFRGKFTAELTKALYKIGAKWNKRLKCFEIAKNKLPQNILGAIASNMVFAMSLRKALKEVLETLTLDNVLDDGLKNVLDIPLDTVLEDLDGYASSAYRYFGAGSEKQYEKSLQEAKDRTLKSEILETFKVKPKLDNSQKQELKDEYIADVSKSIRGFTDEQIIALRELVEKNTREGLDNTTLISEIQKRFNQTLTKAKFLARNETELFTAKFAELQARKVGITHYKWLAIGDERTRPIHKKLNGQIFRYDQPPVTDEKGNTHNPGEDYNCRCVAQPILSV